MKTKAILITFLFFSVYIFNGASLYGQSEKELKQVKKEQKKARKDSVKQDKIDQGKFMISPIVVPAYTPELGGLLAAGGLMSFKNNPDDKITQRSTLPVTVALSTTGAVVFQSILTSYWLKDRIRINGQFWYKNMPDNYWGVGYEKAYNTPVSDTTTAFEREWFWIRPQFLFRIREYLYAGLNVDINYTSGSNAAVVVENDIYYQKYNDKPFNAGLGLILQYDSRDIPVNAWKGLLINFDYTVYGSYIGGDNDYSVLNMDLRHYINTGRKGSTFAMQVRGRFGFGDIPYGEMSQLGTPWDLRGYTWGRYRDESMVFFMAEYRLQFSKPNGTLRKSGMVAWVGGGSIFGVGNSEEQNNKILPNFGVGYRFEMQPRMNMRIDMGFGRETMGIYFNFNEAF